MLGGGIVTLTGLQGELQGVQQVPYSSLRHGCCQGL